MGVVSLVLGLVGLIISFIPCLGAYGLVLTIPGVIFGVIGMMKAKGANEGKGLAIGGLVVSLIGTAIAIIWCVLMKKTVDVIDDAAKEYQKSVEQSKSSSSALDKALSGKANEITLGEMAKGAEKMLSETDKMNKDIDNMKRQADEAIGDMKRQADEAKKKAGEALNQLKSLGF